MCDGAVKTLHLRNLWTLHMKLFDDVILKNQGFYEIIMSAFVKLLTESMIMVRLFGFGNVYGG